jgi:hypothetical protein
MEIIQQVDKAQLEETCVLMNGDELDASREGKNKPYKVTSPLHLLNHLHSCSLSPRKLFLSTFMFRRRFGMFLVQERGQ